MKKWLIPLALSAGLISANAAAQTQVNRVTTKSATSSQWLRSLGTDGVFTASQPAASDITFTSVGTGALLSDAYSRLYGMSSEITDFCTPAQIAGDITSCAQNAINAAQATATSQQGGRVIHFPAYLGAYSLLGNLSITSNFVTIAGDGQQATRIVCANLAADCITIGPSSGSQIRDVAIRDLSIWGSGKTGGAGIHVQHAYSTLIHNVSLESMWSGLDIDLDTNTTKLRDVLVNMAAGSTGRGIYYHSPTSSRSDVLDVQDVVVEGNWTASTAFEWDGPAYTLVGTGLRLLHSSYGLRIRNTAGNSYAYPQFANLHDFEAEGFTTRALSMESGADIKIANADINNLTGGGPGGATTDDYAVALYQDGGGDHQETRGLQIVNSRIGASQNSGVYDAARGLQLSNVVFFSTSMSGVSAHPVIHLASTSDRTQIANIQCEEFRGAAKAGDCILVDAGATNAQASNIDPTGINGAVLNDPSGALGFSAPAGGFGTFNPGADGALAGVRNDVNGDTTFKVTNQSSGAAANSKINLATKTANSYVMLELFDNSGSPTADIAFGPAVTQFTLPTIARLQMQQPGGVVTDTTTVLKNGCIDAEKMYGVNGTAGDGARLQNALNQASTYGGRCVYLHPMPGTPAYLDTGVTIPNGVALKGDGGRVYAGASATIAQWSASGSWVQCADATNACIKLQGNGAVLDGINMIWDQVVPTTGTYAPTTFPYGVSVTDTMYTIKNVMMVGCSHGISVDPGSSGGGTYSVIEDVFEGCTNVGLRIDNTNDVLAIRNFHSRGLWYQSNTSLVNYELANKISADIHYLDNVQWSGFESFQAKYGMFFTNGTVLGNTHSCYNCQFEDMQFSLNRVAMATADNTTIVTGSFGKVLAQQNDGLSDTFFQLGDNVDIGITELRVPVVGGTVLSLGGGAGGSLNIGRLWVNNYSSVASGQVALVANAGASLSVGYAGKFYKSGTAGARFGGAGVFGPVKFSWTPFGNYGQFPSTAGSGAAVGVTVINQNSLIDLHASMGRISGQLLVSVASPATSCTIYSSNYPEITATINTSATGWQSYDSNLLSIGNESVGTSVGQIMLNCPTGVTISNGFVNLRAY